MFQKIKEWFFKFLLVLIKIDHGAKQEDDSESAPKCMQRYIQSRRNQDELNRRNKDF